MPPTRALAALLAFLLCGCAAKAKEEIDPGVLRWKVTPTAAGAAALTAATFEHRYGDAFIHADRYSSCSGGVLGLGEKCGTKNPALEGIASGATILIEVDGPFVMGANTVKTGLYQDPKQRRNLKMTNTKLEVTALRTATSARGSNGATLLAWICARGSAELLELDGAGVAGAVRFAVVHVNASEPDSEPPECSADL